MDVTLFAGYSSFWYAENSKKASDPIGSVGFGILGDYYINDRWSFHTGFSYLTMGGANLNYGDGYPSDGTEKLGYLNIPLHANWHFAKKRNWNINFGLTPCALLSSKGVYPGIIGTSVQLQEIRYRFQLGACSGIGYQFPINERFNLLANYEMFYGLTDVTKNDNTFTNNFGYNFNIGGVFKL